MSARYRSSPPTDSPVHAGTEGAEAVPAGTNQPEAVASSDRGLRRVHPRDRLGRRGRRRGRAGGGRARPAPVSHGVDLGGRAHDPGGRQSGRPRAPRRPRSPREQLGVHPLSLGQHAAGVALLPWLRQSRGIRGTAADRAVDPCGGAERSTDPLGPLDSDLGADLRERQVQLVDDPLELTVARTDARLAPQSPRR